jgi:predicted TIM-barrel fold metal-dependent hydrolase
VLDRLFDQLGVRAAGKGAAGADNVALAEAERHPGRIIPFSGGQTIRTLINQYGSRVWNLQVVEVEVYLVELEARLRDGSYKGIGEIHVNNFQSNIIGSPQYRWPADAALMQRLWAMSVAYDVPLSIHMDAEAESVAQMERLLASDRRGTWLWAHTGHYADPGLLRRLLSEHPNLYCELSYRTSASPGRVTTAMDNGGTLLPAWRELLEAFPDRFVIGTDLSFPSPATYSAHMAMWRRILQQLSPETAAKLAVGNAERLVGLGP